MKKQTGRQTGNMKGRKEGKRKEKKGKEGRNKQPSARKIIILKEGRKAGRWLTQKNNWGAGCNPTALHHRQPAWRPNRNGVMDIRDI